MMRKWWLMSKQLNGQEKSELVHDVFQNVSTKYDRLNDIISFNQHKSWRKYTMKQMKVKKGAKALDVCCGTGDWTLQMSQAVGSHGHVTGLDFSDNMLSVAHKKQIISQMLILFMVMQWIYHLKTIHLTIRQLVLDYAICRITRKA